MVNLARSTTCPVSHFVVALRMSTIELCSTEKRLRSNGHAKKFLRLNNVRGCRTLKAELRGFIDLKLRGFPLKHRRVWLVGFEAQKVLAWQLLLSRFSVGDSLIF
jgi:hypothetical protein